MRNGAIFIQEVGNNFSLTDNGLNTEFFKIQELGNKLV